MWKRVKWIVRKDIGLNKNEGMCGVVLFFIVGWVWILNFLLGCFVFYDFKNVKFFDWFLSGNIVEILVGNLIFFKMVFKLCKKFDIYVSYDKESIRSLWVVWFIFIVFGCIGFMICRIFVNCYNILLNIIILCN